jgi:hypothetical protein
MDFTENIKKKSSQDHSEGSHMERGLFFQDPATDVDFNCEERKRSTSVPDRKKQLNQTY